MRLLMALDVWRRKRPKLSTERFFSPGKQVWLLTDIYRNQAETTDENDQMTLAAAAAFFATSVAVAAPMKFVKADANGDGAADAAEFAASGMKRTWPSSTRTATASSARKSIRPAWTKTANN